MSSDERGDKLIADAIQSALRTQIIGRDVVVLESTASTNDSVLHRTTAETPEGLVIFAEEQTAGRGRRGNRWESPAGQGLWFSILLRPNIEVNRSEMLTAWAAESVAGLIKKQFVLPARIKTPNDIYIEDRKIAGVLVEMRAQLKAPHFAIAGIGINVHQAQQDFPADLQPGATSLFMALGQRVNRQQFAIALLRHLDATYRQLCR